MNVGGGRVGMGGGQGDVWCETLKYQTDPGSDCCCCEEWAAYCVHLGLFLLPAERTREAEISVGMF